MNQLTNQILIAVSIVAVLTLAVMFLPKMLKPNVVVKHERDILPVPYYVRDHRPHHHRPRPSPSPYVPHPHRRPHGDRSTPFCEHTKYGCFPGTQTPIP